MSNFSIRRVLVAMALCVGLSNALHAQLILTSVPGGTQVDFFVTESRSGAVGPVTGLIFDRFLFMDFIPAAAFLVGGASFDDLFSFGERPGGTGPGGAYFAVAFTRIPGTSFFDGTIGSDGLNPVVSNSCDPLPPDGFESGQPYWGAGLLPFYYDTCAPGSYVDFRFIVPAQVTFAITPEPASIVFLATGLVPMFWLGRRRNRRKRVNGLA